MSTNRSILPIILPPLILGVMAGIMSRVAAGTGMGFYFAGVALSGMLVPLLIAPRTRLLDVLLVAGGVMDGIAIVWLIFVFRSNVTFGQWLGAYLVLIAAGAALGGLSLALTRIFGASVAGALTVVLWIAWLGCPIWSPAIAASTAGVHPLMALNRLFINEGIWTQQRWMYQITALGQDVPYALPTSIVACVFAHTITALATGWPAVKWRRRAASAGLPSASSPAP